MRKLATVLCLLVLCFSLSSAQTWNIALDPSATVKGVVTVQYTLPDGTVPVLSKAGDYIDEVTIWRTGDGTISQTLVAASKPGVQSHAAVLNGVATGLIARPSSDV